MQKSPDRLRGIVKFYVSIMILLALSWPRYMFFDVAGLRLSPYTFLSLLAWILIPVWAIASIRFRQLLEGAISRQKVALWAFAVWFVWRYVAGFLGQDPALSFNEVSRDFVYFAPLCVLTMVLVQYENGLRTVLRMAILSTLVALSVAYIEQATRLTIGQMLNLPITGDPVLLAEAMRPNYRGGQLRSKSTFFHPIVFSQYLAWVAPLLILSLGSRGGKLNGVAAVVCFALLPFGLLATGTRSGIIGVFTSIAIYASLRLIQAFRASFGVRSLLVVIGGLMALLITLLSDELLSSLIEGGNSVEQGSTMVRWLMLEIGIANVQRSPIFGFGDGMAAMFAGNFMGSSAFATIDNYYLSSLLNTGYVGLFLHVFAWGALFAAAIHRTISSNEKADAAIAASITSIMLLFSIVSLTDAVSFLLLSLALVTRPRTSTASGARITRPDPEEALSFRMPDHRYAVLGHAPQT